MPEGDHSSMVKHLWDMTSIVFYRALMTLDTVRCADLC